jgi:hypothetical protein
MFICRLLLLNFTPEFQSEADGIFVIFLAVRATNFGVMSLIPTLLQHIIEY